MPLFEMDFDYSLSLVLLISWMNGRKKGSFTRLIFELRLHYNGISDFCGRLQVIQLAILLLIQ